MILDVPFYTNAGDGRQCLQASLQSLIKYYLNTDYSLEELDELTGRKPAQWSWTVQGALALYNLGLDVCLYSTADLSEVIHGESYIRAEFGRNAEKILSLTDVPAIVDATKRVMAL